MPVRYDVKGRLLRLVGEGEYSHNDMMDTFARAMADVRCPDPAMFLIDIRKSESMHKRSPEELQQVVEFLTPHLDRIGRRVAIVVDSDAHYGLGRMSMVFATEIGVQASVFRDDKSALDWLEVGTPATGSRPGDRS